MADDWEKTMFVLTTGGWIVHSSVDGVDYINIRLLEMNTIS